MSTHPATKVAEPILTDERALFEAAARALDIPTNSTLAFKMFQAGRAALGRAVAPSDAAVQPTQQSALEAARNMAYPVPDSPHASVMQRAVNDRIAFSRGFKAASGSAQPANPDGPFNKHLIHSMARRLAFVSGESDAGGDNFHFSSDALMRYVEEIASFMQAQRDYNADSATQAATVTGAQAGAGEDARDAARDAARYRWLAENSSIGSGLAGCEAASRKISVVRLPMLEGASLDSAIDAAIKASSTQAGAGDDARDAARGRYVVENAEWQRYKPDDGPSYALMVIRLPYETNMSSKGSREDALDAAIKAMAAVGVV